MSDPKIPVTEDELHAYVDNELPAERRGDVEAWLATHPDDAERVRSWRTMADALHARYDAIADEPIPRRLEIERLVRQPRKWIYGAIAATLVGFIAGGRLLPGPTGPASFLMYESASGERFTIYTARAAAGTTQMRYARQDKDGALSWAERGVAYVVSGSSDRERLTQVARLVYDQTEKSGG